MPSFDALNISSIAPMGISVVFGIVILVLDLILGRFSRALCVGLSAISLLFSLTLLLDTPFAASGFFGLVLLDGFAAISQIIILVASLLFIFLAIPRLRFSELENSEFYALFLFMVAGYQFMVSSSHLVVIFLALETSSLALYGLIALAKKSKSLEAAIKYFTLGALSSGFFAFGLALIYAACGSLNLADLADSLETLIMLENSQSTKFFALLGFVFMIGALGFKLSFFPFHTWVADIYEGSSAALAFYMSIATKIAAFAVALRVFGVFLDSVFGFGEVALFIIVALTTTVPNLIALLQKDVARMLAYSSISQAGFGLACIYAGSEQATVALFFYWILFLFTNLGAFGLLWLSQNKTRLFDKRFDFPYAKFSGLVRISPVMAVVFGVFMLSLVGVPPFGLFWGKVYLISAVINANSGAMAAILLLNSAIAAYYYLKLIVFMFFKEPNKGSSPESFKENATGAAIFVVFIALFVSVCAVFFGDFFIEFIVKYLYFF